MTIVLHLISTAVWNSLEANDPIVNSSLSTDGFIHCTDTHAVLLAVANNFYASDLQPYSVLHVDTEQLSCSCVWEAPAHPSAASKEFTETAQEIRFPHIYGAIDRGAIHAVQPALRGPSGEFVGFGELDLVGAE